MLRGNTIAAGLLTALVAAGPVVASFDDALAQTPGYPSKAVRVIIPLSPGSAVDIMPRLVFEEVAQQVGQSFVFENRVGAGGTIGVNAVAKADPDGYTILAHSNGHTMAPAFFAKLPYDIDTDFAGITPLGNLPHVLVIATSQNIKTVQDLVAAAKSRDGGITYGAILATRARRKR
jgi:tripartite-type tricarboxylate transporter receptor subunit TctC